MPSSTINTKSAVAAIKSAAAEGTPIQEITNLTITPGPNSVSFSFQTLFASSALIEIFAYKTGDPNKDIQPTNLVTSNAAQLPGASRKKKNQYRLPEPDSFTPTFFPGFSDTLTTPLNQDSHFWFRITADSTISGVVPAVTIGRFWTAQRNVIATVDELLVYSYGDGDIGNDVDQAVNGLASLAGLNPPNQSDFHMDLSLGLYDQVQDLVDQVEKVFDSESQSDDLPNPFPKALSCNNAHDFLWLFAHGQGNTGQWNIGPFTGQYNLPNTPPAAGQNGKDDSGVPFAEAVGVTHRLPDTEAELQTMQSQGQYPVQVTLATASGDTSYQATVRMIASFIQPRHAPVIDGTPVQIVKNLKTRKM